MQGKVRLALSSYIAVVVGCAPAFALQEPGVAPARLVAVNSVPVDRGVVAPAPSPARAVAVVRFPHASAAAAETLAVSVRGPAEVRAAGSPSYRASVANGTDGSR